LVFFSMVCLSRDHGPRCQFWDSRTSTWCRCSIFRASIHSARTELLQESISSDTWGRVCWCASPPSSSSWCRCRCRTATSKTTATPSGLERSGSSSTSGRTAAALTAAGWRKHGLEMCCSTSEDCHRQTLVDRARFDRG